MTKARFIIAGFMVTGLGLALLAAWAAGMEAAPDGYQQITQFRAPGQAAPGKPPRPPQASPGPGLIKTPRPPVTHTRPPQWQLPPGWQKSMGFGLRPRPQNNYPGYYYYRRPQRQGGYDSGLEAYWSGLYTGLALGGQLGASEAPSQREKTWSVWAEPPATPAQPAAPARPAPPKKPVENYDYQYEQWQKSWP